MNVVDGKLGRVLLVGGCGFLGYHTIIDLIQNTEATIPADVHVFDIKTARDLPFYCHQVPDSNYHQGDILDTTRVEDVLNQVKPAVIFDFISPPMFEFSLSYYMKVNVTARAKLLELASENDTKAFVYNSSAGVVHDSYSDLPDADESLPVLYMPQQREPYSHSKAVAETMVLDANASAGANGCKMLTAALRVCSPFGENQTETTNVLIENARAGKHRYQIGKGQNLTDWTYIENGVRAYLLAAQSLLAIHDARNAVPEERRVDGQAFFITNGEPIPFWDFTRNLSAAAGFPVDPKEVVVIPRGMGMAMAFASEWLTWIMSFGRKRSTFTRHGVRYSTITRVHRIDKARQRLKYQPFVTLAEGIEKATASLRNDKKSS